MPGTWDTLFEEAVASIPQTTRAYRVCCSSNDSSCPSHSLKEGCARDAGHHLTPMGATELDGSRSGRLKKRATPTERALARVCREAGARVMFNVCFSGTHLAIDITLRSPLTSAGEAHPSAADTDGAVLLQARRDKERTYPEADSRTLQAGCSGHRDRWALGPRRGCNSCDNSPWPKPGKCQHTWQDAFLLRGNADGHDCCPQSVQLVSPRLSWNQSRSATPSVALEVRHLFWRTCLGRIQGDCRSTQID